MRKPRKSDGTTYLGKCECGGQVRGVHQFGQWFSWCESCKEGVAVRIADIENQRDVALAEVEYLKGELQYYLDGGVK